MRWGLGCSLFCGTMIHMKILKILASLLLIIPTIFSLYLGFIGILYHSLYYLLIPVILIGINISLYKHNRPILFSSIIALVATIISNGLYLGVFSTVSINTLLAMSMYNNIIKFSLVSLICLVCVLVIMIIMASRRQ